MKRGVNSSDVHSINADVREHELVSAVKHGVNSSGMHGINAVSGCMR